MENLFKKKIAAAIGAALLFAVVSGIILISQNGGTKEVSGSVLETGAAGSMPAVKSGTKLLFWYEDVSYRDFFEKAAADYFEKTGIRVEAVCIDSLDYMGEIYDKTMQAEEFPDVYLSTGDNLEELYLYGLAEENSNTNAYADACGKAMQASDYQGKTYGYPLAFHSCVFVYQNGYFDGRPDSLQAIIDYSNENEPPEGVEYLLEWDVNDPFFDFLFISNSVTFEKTESEVMNVVYDTKLYEQDMAYFEQILESFSIDANTVSEENIIKNFLEKKTLCAIIDTSDLCHLKDYDYSLMQLPNLNESLTAKTCAITDMLVVNAFSKEKEAAADFAVFVTTQEREALMEYTGNYSVLAPKNMDIADETAYASYESAVLMPDSQDARDFWIQLESTIHKYF